MSKATLFGRLLIRVDASPKMGTGHWMRTQSLAVEWARLGGHVCIATCLNTDEPLLKTPLSKGWRIETITDVAGTDGDAASTRAVVQAWAPQWIVVDGYHFREAYLSSLSACDIPLLIVDDLADRNLGAATAILNQNAYASSIDYTSLTSSSTLLLDGPQFALLRPEFAAHNRETPSSPAEAIHVVITMGGTDPSEATEGAIRALTATEAATPLQITIIVGAGNPRHAQIAAAAQPLSERHPTTVVVNPTNFAELLARADLVISAAGTTTLEIACLGVASALVICADNQVRVARSFDDSGAAVSLGWHHELETPAVRDRIELLLSDEERRSKLARTASLWVDGRGTLRVAESLATWPVSLRSANESDCKRLFEWVNDPLTREMSFQTERIPFTDHEHWYRKKLSDPDTALFIAQDIEGSPVGQIRFDREGAVAILSLSVAPESRGRGLAPKIARNAASKVLMEGWCRKIEAWVREENEPSSKTFLRAGFLPLGAQSRHDDFALLFQLDLETLHCQSNSAIQD
jgi:UDP-2,4-diacetamido-2,4,6-trideoxy-beta-L-altropyranose hydrolase